jgi:putative aldouronate transport system permease protein
MSKESNITVIKPNVNKGFLYEIKKNWALFVMLVPGVLILIINNYIPMHLFLYLF